MRVSGLISLAIIYKALCHILYMELISQEKSDQSGLPFEVRATAALGISVAADALDYIGSPIFALPIVGDIVDAIVMAILYHLTGSKTSTAINSIEFIPLVGDMIPAYTISTLLWIRKASHKKRKDIDRLRMNRSNHAGSITGIKDHIDHENIVDLDNSTPRDSLRTKAMRLYAILRSRVQ
jgi:hypothetical protein